MKILLTGASGFIGGSLLPSLASEHHVTIVCRRLADETPHGNVRQIKGDLCQNETYEKLPEKIDAVIHLAQANVSFPEKSIELMDVNTRSTLMLAEYAQRVEANSFIYASSGSVYRSSPQPRHEDRDVDPSNFYGWTKIFSEKILQEYSSNFNVSILRLFAPYGPTQKDRMIPRIVQRVLQRRPVRVVNGGSPRMNPVFVDDVISVIQQCLSGEGWGTFNLAGPEVVSIVDIAQIAAEVLEIEPSFEKHEDPQASDLIASTDRLLDRLSDHDFTLPSTGIEQIVHSQLRRASLRWAG